MAELVEKGMMVMGPSRDDPQRLVGVFNKELVATLPAADWLKWKRSSGWQANGPRLTKCLLPT